MKKHIRSLNHKIARLGFAAAVALAVGSSASAAPITFGTQQLISGPTDVAPPGPTANAIGYTFGGAGSGTIDGVPFVAFPGVTSIATAYSGYGTDGQPGLYGTLLNVGQYLDNSPGSLTFAVTPGKTYEVGVWIYDGRGSNPNRSDLLSGTGVGGNLATVTFGLGTSAAGGYVWGKFTADGTGFQTINFSPGSNNEQVNGLVLATVVPEPSTFVLAGLAAVGLFVAARRRRKA